MRLKEVDEAYPAGLKASQITDYLAELKAAPFLKELREHDILITADTTVLLSERVATFTLHVPFQPDSVVLDPNDDILCEKTSAVVTSVGTDPRRTGVLGGVPHVRSTLLTLAVEPHSVVMIHAMDGTLLYHGTEQSDLAVIDTQNFPVGIAAISVRTTVFHRTYLVPIVD